MTVPLSHSEANSLQQSSQRPALSAELIQLLRDGLATSGSRRSLSPEGRTAVGKLCDAARRNGWTAEQLVVAVKDACYASPEVTNMSTTSERENVLALIVSACIREFYTGPRTSD
jgi:hypothetical protein